MKTNSRFLQYVFMALLILLPLLGIYIAWITYQYEIVVKGFVGGSLIYFLAYYLRHSNTDLSIGAMSLDPKVFTHMIFVFVGPIIAFWAFAGVLDLISFSVSWLLNSK